MNAKTILITGSSSGFGRLAAELLVLRGHHVIAAMRGGTARAAKVFPAELIRTGRLEGLDLHMEKPESFRSASQLIAEKRGNKLDVLINNAGFGLLGPFEEQSDEQIRYQFEVNFFGPTFLTRELLPALKNARGRIINVSSIAGLVSFPFYGSYSASKHALEGHTEALHYELKRFGVQVALVEPGSFKTEFMGQSMGRVKEQYQRAGSPYAADLRAFESSIAGKNEKFSGDPAKVAHLLVRLSEARRIPLRSIIGSDARLMAMGKQVLPSGWRVAIEDYVFKRMVFRNTGR